MNDLWIDKTPYWLKPEGVKKIEEFKNAIHMGYWCTKHSTGSWNESPVDVFYEKSPDVSKGHSHYFGIYYVERDLFITDAISAFSEPIVGILGEDGEVIVSRFRHDFQQRKGVMIDGGRDYTRHSDPSKLIKVMVKDAEFSFEK